MLGTKAPTPLFQFKGQPFRTQMIGGEPWFLGYDVLNILTVNGSAMAYRRLDEAERTYVSRADLGFGKGRSMVMVSESGLYKLIMRSDKPEAKAFQDWVTSPAPALPFLPKFLDKLSEEILSAGCFGVRGAEAVPSLYFPDRLSRKPNRPITAHPWR